MRASARHWPLPVPVIGGAVLIASFACGDPYLHTNPYDPAYPVTIMIAGPDSLFSLGEFAQYTANAAPAFPDTAFAWTIDTLTVPQGTRDGLRDTIEDGGVFLKAAGAGGFQSIAPPLEPAVLRLAIGASIGSIDTTVARYPQGTIHTSGYRHTGYKTLILTQRVTRIQLRCPDAHACDALPVGGVWSVWVDVFDALNRQGYSVTGSTANPRTGPPIATYTSRDTTIASVSPVLTRAANVTGRKVGSTWIVATRGALADSLQLVVH